MLSMCRTLRFMTPSIIKREQLYLQIKDIKDQIALVSLMDMLPEDVKAQMIDECRKELHELELQLAEMEFVI